MPCAITRSAKGSGHRRRCEDDPRLRFSPVPTEHQTSRTGATRRCSTMSWVARGGRLYEYRSVRRGGKVTSEYVSRGTDNDLEAKLAGLDEQLREIARLEAAGLREKLDRLAERGRPCFAGSPEGPRLMAFQHPTRKPCDDPTQVRHYRFRPRECRFHRSRERCRLRSPAWVLASWSPSATPSISSAAGRSISKTRSSWPHSRNGWPRLASRSRRCYPQNRDQGRDGTDRASGCVSSIHRVRLERASQLRAEIMIESFMAEVQVVLNSELGGP